MKKFWMLSAAVLVGLSLSACRITEAPVGSHISIRNSTPEWFDEVSCTQGLQVIATAKGITVESPLVAYGESWDSPGILDAYGLQYSLEATCKTDDNEYVGRISGSVPHVHAWMGVIVGPPRSGGDVCAKVTDGTEIYPCFIGVD